MKGRQSYLGIGAVLAVLIGAAGRLAALLLGYPWHASHLVFARGVLRSFAVVYGALMLAIIVHELGHFVAARLARARVSEVNVGSPPTLISVAMGKVQLRLGLVPRGRVVYANLPSVSRSMAVTAAGPVLNLLTAPLPLVMPVAGSVRYPLALIFATTGLTNLLPYRLRSGRLSDGARLLQGPARRKAETDVRQLLDAPGWRNRPDAADRLLRGFRQDAPSALRRWPTLVIMLSAAGRTEDLLWLHRRNLTLAQSPEPQAVLVVHHAEWVMAARASLRKKDADLAAKRLGWVLQHSDQDQRPGAMHTLAVLRLRQGRPAEVEPLCAEALAAGLEPRQRATVLATVAMARHATGVSGRELLDDALALDPDAELVDEAAAMLASDPAATPLP